MRINDRGPFIRGRIIDLSYAAARRLGMIRSGIKQVRITTLSEHVAQINKKPVIIDNVKKRPVLPVLSSGPQHSTTENHRFHIRVQSFTNREEARILARIFTRSGKDVIIQQFPAGGTYFYRVLVGGGHSIDEAMFYKNFLTGNGFPYAVIVHDS